MIEPSLEVGYRELELIQRPRRTHFESNSSLRPDDLHVALRL